ncbi:ATPase [bacterium (Candidatus Torokbacteria) CG09_land_8_20_14_0_10_42_11]|nr:MAG: ATPase [bacterium (Candidatus Torokbacteria) CG09_land_8_20_14_0_10_42_11]
MFYSRKIYSSLKAHLARKQITVLTGMRRVGKTTLVKQLLSEVQSENKIYFDLERLDHRELFAEKNYETIILALEQRGLDLKQKLYLAIDEMQLAPNLPSVLKYLYENYPIKFIITGSSSFYLKNLFSESLAGRKKIFELFPLDFGEFLTFNAVPFKKNAPKEWRCQFQKTEYARLKGYYEEYINFGGFPEVALAKNQNEKKDLLADIISSYINIDVAALADFRYQKDFYALIKTLAARTGSRLDYAKLSRLTGIARPTLTNYLEFLEKTYLISRLPVFAKSPDREIVKARKLYFCDTGLLRQLAEVSSGAQFENAVFNQLRQGQDELRYYARKSGQEIDFILGRALAVEVKETPLDSDSKTLQSLCAKLKIKKQCLIGRYPSPQFNQYLWGGELR